MPDEHEVEFFGGPLGYYGPFTIPFYSLFAPTTTQLPRGYTYTARYRNKVTSTCAGPWIVPSETVIW